MFVCVFLRDEIVVCVLVVWFLCYRIAAPHPNMCHLSSQKNSHTKVKDTLRKSIHMESIKKMPILYFQLQPHLPKCIKLSKTHRCQTQSPCVINTIIKEFFFLVLLFVSAHTPTKIDTSLILSWHPPIHYLLNDKHLMNLVPIYCFNFTDFSDSNTREDSNSRFSFRRNDFHRFILIFSVNNMENVWSNSSCLIFIVDR